MIPHTRSLTLALLLLVIAALFLPGPQAAGDDRTLELTDGTITVTVTYAPVLNTDVNYQFDLQVAWNGSTQDYSLLIDLEGRTYTKSLGPSDTHYAQVISQNTFDRDSFNTPVVLTLRQAGKEVASAQGQLDINFKQADDMIYLYLGYTFIWAGVFGYLLYLHKGQERLSAQLQRLKTHHDQDGSSDPLATRHGGGNEEAVEDGQ